MARLRLLLTTSEDYDSSIQRDIVSIVRLLDSARFESAVACPFGAPVDLFEAAGAATFRVDMPTKYDPRPIFGLSRVLRQYRPDIIHSHTTRATLFSSLAARRSGVPVVQTEHLWTDALTAVDTEYRPRRMTRILHRMLTRDMIALIIVYSQASANFYLKLQKVERSKVKTIRYAVDPPPPIDMSTVAAKREQLGIDPEALVVSSFGNLVLVKGLSYLIDAVPAVLASHPEMILCLFGHGTEQSNLELQAKRLGVGDRVIFAGRRDDVFDMMAMTDVVASPSLSESAGRIVMESMAAGKPLVVSNVGAQPEYVGDETVALIVPPMDSGALADALVKLLSDRSLRERMGAASRHRYEIEFRPERYVGEIQETYLEVLGLSGM